MTNLERLKLELSKKQYFTEAEYGIYLNENDLMAADEYIQENRRSILSTVYDILQALANNIELYCRIETEFSTTTEAFSNLEKRISNIRQRIVTIDQDSGQESLSSNFSVMYRG